MKKEVVGCVTEEEKEEVSNYFYRGEALKELLQSLPSQSLNDQEYEVYYQRIIDDMAQTKARYDDWWYRIPKKYGWQLNARYILNFQTNKILLE